MAEVIIETTTDETEAKPYTFRTLNAGDVAPMCAIIGKIGINNFTKCFDSEELLEVIQGGKSAKNLTNLAGMTVAFDMANIIISHISECEKDIFNLLAKVSGLKVDAIKAFDLATFAEMVIDFVKKEEFKDFFKVASKSFK